MHLKKKIPPCGGLNKGLTVSKMLRTHFQFQSTPRNIRNLFKMADRRFPFLSFILGLISNLTACFQANLALLILQTDYSRRRQNIIRLLSLPVLDLPLVWLWHLKLFLRLWRTSQQYKPKPKEIKEGANLLFRGLMIANTYTSRMSRRVNYRFQIDSSYTCGRTKTMRKRYEWTRIFLNTEKKVAFSNEYGYVWTVP